MKTTFQLTAAVAASALLAVQAQAANLILDGGFDSGITIGSNTNYLKPVELDAGWVTASAQWEIIGGQASMKNTKWLVQAVSIDAEGTGLNISFDWAPTAGNPTDVQFFLRGRSAFPTGTSNVLNLGNGKVLNVSGTTIDFVSGNAVVNSTVNPYAAAGTAGISTPVSVDFDFGATGITNLSELNYLEVGFKSNGTGDGTLDNVSVTAIPEPGSLALLGLGGLCVLKRRRRD